MKLLLLYVILPLILNTGLMVMCLRFGRLSVGGIKGISRRFACLFAGEAAGLSLLQLVLERCMMHNPTIFSGRSVVLLCLPVSLLLGVGLPVYGRRSHRAHVFFKWGGFLCVLLFLTEIFVCNAKSFDTKQKTKHVDFSSIEITESSTSTLADHALTFSGDTTFVLHGPFPEEYAYLTMYTSGGGTRMQVRLGVKDNNFSGQYIHVGNKYYAFTNGKFTFAFDAYQQTRGLEVKCTNIGTPLTISNIVLTTAPYFNFSEIRFFAVYLCCLLILGIWASRIWRVRFDVRSRRHKLAILLVCFLSVELLTVFAAPGGMQMVYPWEGNAKDRDPYVQMVDAFEHGRLSIDVPVEEELLELENPYDKNQRQKSEVEYPWDRALYNGKYYAYFGVAPVLTFYYPYYWMTGHLPTMNTATLWFSLWSVLFLFGLVMTLLRLWHPHPNLLLLLLGLFATVVGSGIYMYAQQSNQYIVAMVSALSWLLLTLWLGFAAYGAPEGKHRLKLLAGAGVAFILTVASRPSMAPMGLILAPAFLDILFRQEKKISRKLLSAGVFLAPVLAGAAGLMWFNQARFGSPFNFGAVYQLTVSDIHANTLRLRDLPAAMMHYFFTFLQFDSNFPFFKLNGATYANYTGYRYLSAGVGVMAIPSVCVGLCSLPFLLRKGKGKGVMHATCILTLLLSIGIAWVDFCMAGYTLRYLVDILPMLSILSLLALLRLYDRFDSIPRMRARAGVAISGVFAANIPVFAIIILQLAGGMLLQRYPNLWTELEECIAFWR